MINRVECRLSGNGAISAGGSADSYEDRCLVCFRQLEWGGYGSVSLQNQRFGFGHLITSPIADVPSFALRTSMSSRCIAVAAVCRTPSGELSLGLFSVDQACIQSASHCLVTVLAVTIAPV